VETAIRGMANRIKLMPSCFLADGSVFFFIFFYAPGQKIQSRESRRRSDLLAVEMKSSPRYSARICSEDEVRSASVRRTMNQRIDGRNLRQMLFLCGRRISGVPVQIQMPKLDRGDRAPIAPSPREDLASPASSPRRIFRGKSGTVQALSRIRSNQTRCGSDDDFVWRPPQNGLRLTSSAAASSGGQLAVETGEVRAEFVQIETMAAIPYGMLDRP